MQLALIWCAVDKTTEISVAHALRHVLPPKPNWIFPVGENASDMCYMCERALLEKCLDLILVLGSCEKTAVVDYDLQTCKNRARGLYQNDAASWGEKVGSGSIYSATLCDIIQPSAALANHIHASMPSRWITLLGQHHMSMNDETVTARITF